MQPICCPSIGNLLIGQTSEKNVYVFYHAQQRFVEEAEVEINLLLNLKIGIVSIFHILPLSPAKFLK